jgi:hypothetical protein
MTTLGGMWMTATFAFLQLVIRWTSSRGFRGFKYVYFDVTTFKKYCQNILYTMLLFCLIDKGQEFIFACNFVLDIVFV